MKARSRLFLMLAALLSAALAFLSCNDPPVTLGGRLDMYPPELALSRPDFMENVRDTVLIAGAVDDDTDVTLLLVTIEGIGRQWKNESGKWRTRENESSAWQDCAGTWDALGQGKYLFSIAVSLEGAEEGEYLVTISAEDRFKNTGASAIKQRPVVLVLSPPAVRMLSPALQMGTSVNASAIFDNYQLKDPAALDKLLNVNVKVQWEITANSPVDSLELSLADSGGGVYFTKTIEYPPRNSSIVISEDEIVTENGDKVTDKKYLQIISRAKDRAGNDQSYSHGWFVYWPDADRPWIEGAGDENYADNFQVYPGSEVQARAYDDDGVKQVSYTVYPAGSHFPLEGYPRLLENKPIVEGASPSTFFGWKFVALEESGKYRITADVWDVNGIIGGTFTGFFTVMDSSAPSVTVTSPSPDDTLFGDRWGTFTFTGIAGDGVNPENLRLAWLDSRGDMAEALITYRSVDSWQWDIDSYGSSGTDRSGDPYWEENGNRVWDINLGEGKTTENGRMEKMFSKRINLFSDLGIGTANPLEAQTFVLRVTGDSGRAVTVVHSVRGDIIPPRLSAEKLTVLRGGTSAEYDIDTLKNATPEPLEENDEITLSGSWGDDSFFVWGDTARMGTFNVEWNGENLAAVLRRDGTWEAGPLVVQTALLSETSVEIRANLADLGGNITEWSALIKLDNNAPRLMRVSAQEDNGAYMAGKTFNIYLEFNKDVTFSGGYSNPALVLNNSRMAVYKEGNGSRRHIFTYTSMDGDDTDLIAAAMDNYYPNKRLNVDDIIRNNNIWKGMGGTASLDIPYRDDGKEANLAWNKNIRIDTIPPKITKLLPNVTTIYVPGSILLIKEGSLQITVEFDEDIEFTPDPDNNAVLVLNLEGPGDHGINPVVAGERSLLFTYTVVDGQNSIGNYYGYQEMTRALSLELNGAMVKDTAGNIYDSSLSLITSIPLQQNNMGNGNNSLLNIVIRTTPNDPPVVKLKPDDQTPQSKGFQIDYTMGRFMNIGVSQSLFSARREYKVRSKNGNEWGGWSQWNLYETNSSSRVIAVGTHQIVARHIDPVGNISEDSQPLEITNEPYSPLFLGWSGVSGNYTTGDTVTITLFLREPAEVTGPLHIVLYETIYGDPTFDSGRFSRRVPLDPASNGTNALKFSFTARATDSVSLLNVSSIVQSGVTLKRPNSDVSFSLLQAPIALYNFVRISINQP